MADERIDLVCFGELLWDLLPGGRVAGGAPFNIVNRASALGLNAYVISSVGNDELGEEITDVVRDLGNNTTYVQTHPNLPTSTVNVLVGPGGEPQYEIVHPVAWDDIIIDDGVIDLVRQTRAFVYSSLALRDERSRTSLFSLLPHSSLKICDVNLREGHYSDTTILDMITAADILKMNESELSMISKWMDMERLDREEQILNLHETYNYEAVIITLGSEGALAYAQGKWARQPVFDVNVRDTVGSGDAFLAAFITRYLHEDKLADCLRFACAVGALTAANSGGTPIITDEEIQQLLANSV